MPVRRANERLVKMKPKKNLNLPNSKLRKIVIKSERETGFKTIRARPAWSEKKQDAFLDKKIERKITQAVTGRVMDIMKIIDPTVRKKLHLQTQKFLNSQRSEQDTKTFVTSIRTLLGQKNSERFMQLVENGINTNFDFID